MWFPNCDPNIMTPSIGKGDKPFSFEDVILGAYYFDELQFGFRSDILLDVLKSRHFRKVNSKLPNCCASKIVPGQASRSE